MKRTFRKLFFVAVFMVLMTVVLCFGVSAKTVPASGKCGANVTYTYNSSTGELVISGTGAMYNYNSSSSPFCQSDIKSVVIKNGVTTIGDFSFRYCTNLQSVTILDSVTIIGNYAFFGCDSLQNVVIPDSVTIIGDYVFNNCISLKSITIGSCLNTIGLIAFLNCSSLQSITVDKNNKTYSNDAYGVLFNKNKTELIQYPIGNMRSTYIMPNSVISVKGFAFYHCNTLQNITILDNVTTIGNSAFSYCDNLQSVTIGNSVTTIESSAFYSCKSLQSIIIPDSVKNIGSSAFYSCKSLQSIIIPDSVKKIGSSAFGYCDELQSVTIGDSITTIGNSVFEHCYNLKIVTIPDNVTAFGDSAFRYCYNLKSITIPVSVTIIENYAFDQCFSLKNVYYTGTQEQWKSILIEGYNTYVMNSTIHYNCCGSTHKKNVKKPQQNPTCTEVGYTAGEYCTNCERWISGHEEIPATGHTYKTTTTKATLTKNGSIVTACTVCGTKKSTTTIYYPKNLTLSTTKYIYDGKNKTPKVTIKDSEGKVLTKNVDYKLVVASKRAGVGRYTVKVTFMGNYSGTKSLYFYVLPGKPATVKSASQSTSAIKLTWSSVPGAVGYTVYRYSPSKKAYVKAGTTEGTTLTVSKLLTGTKYTFRVVAYGKTASGKVYDSETYALLKSATKTKTPELTKVTASSTKGKAYVYHTNVAGETGYTVYYSTSKTTGFKKYANFKADTTRCDITKLTSGKTYYFKVRTYIKTDSGYVYSAWSNIKGVKVK